MCIRMKISLIVMITCFFLFGAAYAGESLDADIQQLRKIGIVDGAAVGASPQPGSFYSLIKNFLKKGTEDDFIKLTEDKNPIVRSMGLLCLAVNKKSINILREHLTDRDMIHYCPLGDVIEGNTVGGFVWELLHNVNLLNLAEPSPVLSEDQLIGLDIEVLSKDSTTSFHIITATTCFPNIPVTTYFPSSSAMILPDFVNEKEIALTLPELKKYASQLETYQIIKAIGRLGDSNDKREFLFTCVRDENLDHVSRLAAASALTRDANEAVLSFIESQRTHLNDLTKENLGDRFLETIQNRISHEKYMEVVRELSWRKKENLDDVVLKALSNSHPLAFPDLTNDDYLIFGPHHNQVCAVVGNSFVEMSRNLEKFNQPWSTYSDIAYALDFVKLFKNGSLFRDVFTPAKYTEIERNVEKAIANHFEEKSKSSGKN